MNKINIIIVSVVGIAILIGIIGKFNMPSKEVVESESQAVNKIDQVDTENSTSSEQGMMDKGDSMSDDSNMDKKENSMKMGVYESYSPDKIARASTGDVVLFFHASWCPSCRGLNTSIENNLKSIPEGVSILKADYDKEVELKKKYGITSQHTMVQVDIDGNMIKKWSGSPSLDSLLSQIK